MEYDWKSMQAVVVAGLPPRRRSGVYRNGEPRNYVRVQRFKKRLYRRLLVPKLQAKEVSHAAF